MNIFLRWLVLAVSVYLVAYFMPGFTVSGFVPALMLALVLGILNVLVKPILLILTLPINVLTLGLFTLVLNGFLLYVAGYFVSGFSVDGWFNLILAALLISVVNGILSPGKKD
jgi:putative membrane protein